MRLSDNCFEIQGIRITDLANEHGTPVYIYDADELRQKYDALTSAFAGIDMRVKYAMKANACLAILDYLRTLGAGLDTVSVPEIRMALITGFDPADIVFTPNMVSFTEIEEAAGLGVKINIENLSNLEKFGKRFGNQLPCCIRLNPYIVEGDLSDKVKKWYASSKFGITLHQFDEIWKIIRKYNIRVNGLHMHASHVIMSDKLLTRASETVFRLAMDFPHLEYLDLGGGMRVPHGPEEEVLTINDLARIITPRFTDLCSRAGKRLQLWFEPGRYLVSGSGILVTRVMIMKTIGEKKYAGTDTGFNHLIRPKLYHAWHEVLNLSHPEGKPSAYTIVGNLCEDDTFAEDRLIPQIREGDLLALLNAGAYGYSMSSQYNARFRPPEVLVRDGKAFLVRKRETLDDLLRNQHIPG